MQFNIKLVVGCLTIGLVAYFVFILYKPNTPTMQPNKQHMPTMAKAMPGISPIDIRHDIDRQTLVKEIPELIPANEVIQMNYKALDGVEDLDKELYTNDKPLFNLNGPVNLVPLDLNGEHRRVNFY